MYFLMACRDEPPRSLRLFTALLTISEVGGCEGLARAFLAPALAAAPFLDAEEAADAGRGFTATVPAGCEGGEAAAAALAAASAMSKLQN
jgi:hypothetical protein